MDTIFDKLSQKFTAQEIIKANSEADAKSLERVQNQVRQYDACLEEMKKVNSQTKMTLSEIEKTLQAGLDSFESAEIHTDSIAELVEEALMQIKALQKESVDMQSVLEEKFATQGDVLRAAVEEKLVKEKEEITDFVHKECVKVYRNIQAVQVEENTKQTEELAAQIGKSTQQAKAAWSVSVAAFVFSALAVAGIAFELLVMFGILRF